jgi:hypothetical protein
MRLAAYPELVQGSAGAAQEVEELVGGLRVDANGHGIAEVVAGQISAELERHRRHGGAAAVAAAGARGRRHGRLRLMARCRFRICCGFLGRGGCHGRKLVAQVRMERAQAVHPSAVANPGHETRQIVHKVFPVLLHIPEFISSTSALSALCLCQYAENKCLRSIGFK